jgi:carboxyl-terminal processing protease
MVRRQGGRGDPASLRGRGDLSREGGGALTLRAPDPGGGRSGRSALVRTLATVLITAVVTFGATTYFERGRLAADATLRALEAQPAFPRLLQAITLTRRYYVTDPNLNQMVEGAISGAIAALGDPYSQYFNAADYRAFNQQSSGRYGGIGVEVENQGADIVVFRTFPGTPAADTAYQGAPAGAPTGLLPGDRLTQVEGRSVVGVPLQSVSNLIRGTPGSKVTVTVQRPSANGGQGQQLTFVFTRADVVVPTATEAMLPGGIGYLNVNQFTETTPDQVRTSLAALRKAGMRGLVLDLRNNPGGLVDSALGVASQLMPDGLLTYLVDRQGQRQNYTITQGTRLGVPMVVLVNGFTASAAEILAGAIQDRGLAPLVGTQTFGKGIVQRIYPLQGNTGLKITVAHYYTPDGRDINKKGLTPDHVVDFPKTASPNIIGDPSQDTPAVDPQMAEALSVLQGEMRGR